MQVHLSPGEALLIPRFIEPTKALRIGNAIWDALNSGHQLYDRQSIIRASGHKEKMPFDPDTLPLIEEASEKVEEILDDTDPKSSYLVATVMDSVSRHFPWHVDPDFDVRTVVNVSQFTTTVGLSSSRATLDSPEFQCYHAAPPEDDQIELVLEPGDAYIIDNRLAREQRIPHTTPSHSLGRTMLRFNHLYSTFDDESIVLKGIDTEDILFIPRAE